MSVISSNLQAVRQQIANAELAAGRAAGTVNLLAVSKTKPLSDVMLAVAAGQRAFGENYVQEGVEKILATRAMPEVPALSWHFIGPLQSNKTRLVAAHFDWVHSIERLKIAERLSEQRPKDLPPLQVCVQVNVSGEASKSGCLPEETLALCQAVAALPGLNLRGLMAIPEPCDDAVAQRQPFRVMSHLLHSLQQTGLSVDTLSMGMTHDLDAAIAEGATWVRIGTAIFGERNYA